MSFDDLRRVWQTPGAHPRLLVDAELLVNEVRRNQQALAATVFWRDVREVGVSLALVPLWVYLGAVLPLPWTWYLTVPALLWIAGFLLMDRVRHRRQGSAASAPLCESVAGSLAQVEHQIGLLRNVHWWYLLPLALALLAFFVQVTWQTPAPVEVAVFELTGVLTVTALVFAGIYWLNQVAVRRVLEPRRQELRTLLASLQEVPPTE